MSPSTLNIAPGVQLPLDFITESSAILAKKGAGKTNAAIVLLEEVYAAGAPVVSIDPKGDHWGIRADGAGKGLPIPVFGGLHGDIPLEPTAGKYIADLIRSMRLSVVLDVSEFTIGERAKFLAPFADALYRFDAKDPMLLLLEEAHEYIPQSVRSEEARMVGAFERLVKLGRSKGIGVVMVTQRSASLNKNVLTQADNLFVLRTTSPQDRLAVKAWLDANDDTASIIAELPSLQTGECWLVSPVHGDPVKFRWRMRHTYDAGYTPKLGDSPRPPATLADVDLVQISVSMAETIERAKADDPKVLRATIAELRAEMAKRPTEEVVREVEKVVEVKVAVVDANDVAALRDLVARIEDAKTEIARSADWAKAAAETASDDLTRLLAAADEVLTGKPRRFGELKSQPKMSMTTRPPVALPSSIQSDAGAPDPGDYRPRAGAKRMIESLGRMAPLHLTKAQWGTVSGMKTTSGTWSTYFGELKRNGLIEQNDAGFTLTDAGFEMLGGRPAPMTAGELQNHYRNILRAGAVRMLDAIMAAYPNAIDKDALGEAIEMVTTSGTFSTYLGELVRNGLAEKVDGAYRATDILMRGAAA